MKRSLRRVLVCATLLISYSGSVWAQQAAVTRNVNLRRDPSTSSPVLAHLASGDRLTLVDAGVDSGFYHVRTEDDQVGWVWAKFLKLSPTGVPAIAAAASGECDGSLLPHVYHPDRLHVKQECITVTGTIVDATGGKKHDGVRHEADGDTHGWLKLDPGLEDLLNDGNKSDEDGNLVFEIVCRFPISKKVPDAMTACAGYSDHVILPPVNSHVRIVGRYVQDSFHAKWMEIHPVTSITVIP